MQQKSINFPILVKMNDAMSLVILICFLCIAECVRQDVVADKNKICEITDSVSLALVVTSFA